MSKIGTKRKGKPASSLQIAHRLQVKSFLSQTGDTLHSHSRVGDTLPTILDEWEIVRVMVIGSDRGVNSTIKLLHVLGFAQVGDWSRLLPAPNSSEVMSILTRRLRRERTF